MLDHLVLYFCNKETTAVISSVMEGLGFPSINIALKVDVHVLYYMKLIFSKCNFHLLVC